MYIHGTLKLGLQPPTVRIADQSKRVDSWFGERYVKGSFIFFFTCTAAEAEDDPELEMRQARDFGQRVEAEEREG